MTYEAIIKDLKAGKLAPLYLLHGPEDYYIDKISDYIEHNALSEAERSFNQTIVYGKDAEPIQLLDALRRYPMMAEKQVVILKEAAQMRGMDKLMGYFEKPMPSTIFVIAHKHKNLAKNTKVYKQIAKKAVVLESKKLWDNQVPSFIVQAGKEKKLSIDTRLANLLAEYLGTDLNKIHNELNKLSLNMPDGGKVTQEMIEKFIGVSKDHNVFALNKALCMRDNTQAFRIVNYFISNVKQNPPPLVIGSLFSFFSKAYAFQYMKNSPDGEVMKVLKTYPAAIKDMRLFAKNYNLKQSEKIVNIIHEYDLKMKGLGSNTANKSELFTELVFKVLAA